jgi:hypothetical protein
MQKALLFGCALTLATVGGGWFSPAANADPVKKCTTTTTDDPSNGWTTTVNNDQTSACNSNSDTGFVETSSTTQNPSGKPPPGRQ